MISISEGINESIWMKGKWEKWIEGRWVWIEWNNDGGCWTRVNDVVNIPGMTQSVSDVTKNSIRWKHQMGYLKKYVLSSTSISPWLEHLEKQAKAKLN